MKVNIYTILIALLLSVSFLLALLRFEQPHTHTSSWGDRTRDYLVAHYIVQDGERPLLGYQGGKASSPVYFYLLAGFLKINDSVLFLAIVNILFHVTAIFLIYFIAKSLFGPFKALLSSLLFSLIPDVSRQTEFVFQPHQMQPFAYLALFLLILSYKKNSFKIALFSLVVLSFAGNIHSAAFAWVPVFLVLIFWMVRKKAQRFKFYVITFSTLILSIGMFYLSVLAYYLKNPQLSNGLSINSIFPVPTQNFILNLSHFSSSLMGTFSLNFTDEFQIESFVAATLIMICLTYYFFTQNMRAKITVFIGICFVVLPLLFASLFSLNRGPVYYLFLTFGIFSILITEIVTSSVNHLLKQYQYKLHLLITIIIFLFLIKTMSSDFLFARPNKHPERLLALNGAVSAIEQEISFLNSFQIVSFAHTKEWNFSYYPPLSTIFLLPLEKNLKTKLAKTEDGTGSWGIKQTNFDDFIFLICVEYDNKNFVENCTGSFSQFYPNHRVIKNIYTKYPLNVFLAEKTLVTNERFRPL